MQDPSILEIFITLFTWFVLVAIIEVNVINIINSIRLWKAERDKPTAYMNRKKAIHLCFLLPVVSISLAVVCMVYLSYLEAFLLICLIASWPVMNFWILNQEVDNRIGGCNPQERSHK